MLTFPDISFRDAAAFASIEFNYAGTDIGATDVHRQNGIVPGEDPARCQLDRTDETSFVGMVSDGAEL